MATGVADRVVGSGDGKERGRGEGGQVSGYDGDEGDGDGRDFAALLCMVMVVGVVSDGALPAITSGQSGHWLDTEKREQGGI
jgi:hypothetical protein